MRLTFGPGLDGPCHPDPLAGRPARAGEATLGPAGLLEVLETRLGLRGRWETPLARTLIYAERLRAADSPQRFYSASFRVDELGTAQTLLAWRDQLVQSGWDGAAAAAASARLRDLAAVETAAAEPLPAGTADRLRAVLATLRGARLDIERIRVAVAPELLPAPWPEVLAALAAAGVAVEPLDRPTASAPGDLGRLQEALRKPAGAARTAKATGDGSLVLLEAPSESEAAALLAQRLSDDPEGWVVLAPTGDDALDRALRARGLPGPGAPVSSPARPALQVLPLAFALRFRPFDPHRALELLLLPRGPLPAFAARRLARALAEAPGIGGRAWQRALESIAEDVRSYKAKNPDAGAADPEERLRSLTERIGFWLEAERHDPVEGIPRAEAMQIVEKVIAWACGHNADGGDVVLSAAAAQAAHLRRLLERTSAPRIPRLTIDRLLDAVTGDGVAAPGAGPQAGHIPVVRHPGALLGPAARLLWWDFTENAATVPHRHPWSAAEWQALARAGVRLPDPAVEWQAAAEAQFVPLLAAARALVLVAPARVRGEPVARHPVWDQVIAVFGDSANRLVVPAEAARADGHNWLGRPLKLDPVPPRLLPAPQRWWHVPGAHLAPRDTESYSSLDPFVNYPFVWVLRYAARLRPGALLDLPDLPRLQGTLAHRLIEEIAADDGLVRSSTEAAVRARIEARLAELLPQEGALLLLPGREPDRERLRDRAGAAAWTLVQAMRQGDWRLEAAEKQFLQAWPAGTFEANPDLLLAARRGKRRAILDVKWSRRSRFWDELGENRALQLAVYGQVVRPAGGGWPDVGFLIVDCAEILAWDGAAFPGATIQSDGNGRLPELWQGFEIAWAWRRDQLAAGKVEVPVEGTDPDGDSKPPEGAMPLAEGYSYRDFAHLTGWRENHE